jgi:hypothetical protein
MTMDISQPKLLISSARGKALNKTVTFGTKFGVDLSGPKSLLSYGWWPTKKFLHGIQLLRKGFVGPSRCILCQENEETQDHILSNCSFTSQLWDIGASNFRQIKPPKRKCCGNNRSVERESLYQ